MEAASNCRDFSEWRKVAGRRKHVANPMTSKIPTQRDSTIGLKQLIPVSHLSVIIHAVCFYSNCAMVYSSKRRLTCLP